MKLSATHAFNCIVLMVKFGQISCEDIPPALHSYSQYCFTINKLFKIKSSYEILLKQTDWSW